MYDEVIIEGTGDKLQTHEFKCQGGTYKITEEGILMAQKVYPVCWRGTGEIAKLIEFWDKKNFTGVLTLYGRTFSVDVKIEDGEVQDAGSFKSN